MLRAVGITCSSTRRLRDLALKHKSKRCLVLYGKHPSIDRSRRSVQMSGFTPGVVVSLESKFLVRERRKGNVSPSLSELGRKRSRSGFPQKNDQKRHENPQFLLVSFCGQLNGHSYQCPSANRLSNEVLINHQVAGSHVFGIFFASSVCSCEI